MKQRKTAVLLSQFGVSRCCASLYCFNKYYLYLSFCRKPKSGQSQTLPKTKNVLGGLRLVDKLSGRQGLLLLPASVNSRPASRLASVLPFAIAAALSQDSHPRAVYAFAGSSYTCLQVRTHERRQTRQVIRPGARAGLKIDVLNVNMRDLLHTSSFLKVCKPPGLTF